MRSIVHKEEILLFLSGYKSKMLLSLLKLRFNLNYAVHVKALGLSHGRTTSTSLDFAIVAFTSMAAAYFILPLLFTPSRLPIFEIFLQAVREVGVKHLIYLSYINPSSGPSKLHYKHEQV